MREIKKILPICVEVCYSPNSQNIQVLSIPESYGTICKWQINNRFSSGWTDLPQDCKSNVLVWSQSLALEAFKMQQGKFPLKIRGKLRYGKCESSEDKYFWTNEVNVKLVYVLISKQPISTICEDACENLSI
ncbi:MAG TPA: hypothetical protein VMW10_06090, partial [Alphaproteobacteria bacterium]|nr:hypothetical protein [Alphaproteobacteria bacterium]